MNINKIKQGFTLVEVLLALTVIGVVASIVIPIFLTRSQEDSFAPLLQQTISFLTSANKQALNDEGINSIMSSSGSPTSTTSSVFYVPSASENTSAQFAHLSSINHTDPKPLSEICTDPNYKYHLRYILTKLYTNPGNSLPQMVNATDTSRLNSVPPVTLGTILSNNVLLLVLQLSTKCMVPFSGRNDICNIYLIDVNGCKPPNEGGKDAFALYTLPNGTVIPADADATRVCDANDTQNRAGCAAQVLQSGKIIQ